MPTTVLFVSHKEKQCGVHEFGKNVAAAIAKSSVYSFKNVECAGFEELAEALTFNDPVAVIYNYHPSTMPWLNKKIFHKFFWPQNRGIRVPQIGIMHEVTQEKADKANDYLFDFHIAPDPTLLLKNPKVFKTGRLVPAFTNHQPLPSVPTFGSFGFATPNKGFEDVVRHVNNEFDQAVIRFNIPSADFGDSDGGKARQLVDQCRSLITKKGITLEVSHDFLSQNGILHFLAGNAVNVFLYQDHSGRGISSAADYALAVERPIAISNSTMFRNLHGIRPSIIVGENTLRQIAQQEIDQLKQLKEEWNEENLIWEYERIVRRILAGNNADLSRSRFRKMKLLIERTLGRKGRSFTWLRNTQQATEDDLRPAVGITYEPIALPANASFNRILDNSARELYKPAIAMLTSLVPKTMSEKIAEANVQQAFVFDSVIQFEKNYRRPKMLCVGSYEDTAAMGLKKLGRNMEEIDPVINYYLQEYANKPGVLKGSYDIIFSTSVIEHDPDDASFVNCISDLLAPGGMAILTCDYNDQWKPGDSKPDVDQRLYTQKDLRERLLPSMHDCELIDQPDWDCPHPDFLYLNKYRYTFATFVVRKKKYSK